ncbi:caspase family protein [Bradyrhizobium sp. 147]|uniref:caspase family protein n=1 Tax=Bradyrhizobium sp. 147 TaxID=2782623 RepID=UPI001FFA2EA9|nr:caspase family protein [Bradyrhizobium sp. 147]MCK1683788.1 caspase family protein [Bradyrhizobium sp. 147]
MAVHDESSEVSENVVLPSLHVTVAELAGVPALCRRAGRAGHRRWRVPATVPNPTRDATDIARALERLDFKVTQLSNGTAADMRKALVDFGRSAEGSVMAVDFYAGHGMKAGGEDWLISTDGELRAKQSV